MVGWYEPRQLARTAYQVFLSTIFGRHADRRLVQAVAGDPDSSKEPFFNFSESEKPFWFDYIADVGDGFDSTYTMASHLSETSLELAAEGDDARHKTDRGRILILGGDAVYPIADPKNYKERLIDPYNGVFPRMRKRSEADDPQPTIFAIPGNHDWYDSLVSFSELFCEQRDFGGWNTAQKRSYFALRLPRGWWLFGTDTQLVSTLDKPQIEYFRKVMGHVLASDRIILCNAEPYWINAEVFRHDPAFSDQKMRHFASGVLRGQVAVYIAGDRHYYRRHEEYSIGGQLLPDDFPSKRQKITAGGGGAFMHPTHKENVELIGRSRVYQLECSFPEPAVSSRLGWWNFLFPLWNPWFGLATGLLYLLTARAFLSNLGIYEWHDIYFAVRTVVHDALTEPFSLYWVLIFFTGFIFFTDTSSKIYRWIAGPIHALTHLAAAFLISWQVSYWLSGGTGLDFGSIAQLTYANFLIFATGWIVGPVIMGIYFFVSLNIFGRHHNEAFSALKIADYKNFLRLKIEENGDLVVFPIGVKKVIKSWKKGDRTQNEPELVPSAIRDENIPILIEKPIRFVKPLVDANKDELGKPENRDETPAVNELIEVKVTA